MTEIESLSRPKPEVAQSYPFNALVVLPYTSRQNTSRQKQKAMTYYTDLALSAGLIALRVRHQAPRIILPGEYENPSTGDIEKESLIKRGVNPEMVEVIPNCNSTLEQLRVIAKKINSGQLEKVGIVCFSFHQRRVREFLKGLGIASTCHIVEVEQVLSDFIKEKTRGESSITKEDFIKTPTSWQIKLIETLLFLISKTDRVLFQSRFPLTQYLKTKIGLNITDYEKLESLKSG